LLTAGGQWLATWTVRLIECIDRRYLKSTFRGYNIPVESSATAPVLELPNRLDGAVRQRHRLQRTDAPFRGRYGRAVDGLCQEQRKDEVMHEHLARFT